jgi:hypothetical protein
LLGPAEDGNRTQLGPFGLMITDTRVFN